MPIETPTHLGRYEILDEIGRGAMGVVYMAKDPLIGRLVALKTFRAGSALQGKDLELFRARFIREAQSAGILSHPSIVTIHDVVEESEEGVTFIAMEYVQGTNLKDILRTEGRLELEEAAHVLREVAEGLEYAHSRGVVHRDVKPANILLTEERRVKLTDFGIARLGTSSLTHDGQLLGTPNYMAPEQIRGEAADHRADVFSLGVVLYEMLTGEKPFQGDNVTVVTHRIAYEDFIPPERHGEGLPDVVGEVIGRALAKDPDQRFPSVAEMARALQEAVTAIRTEERLNQTQEISPVQPPGDAESSGGAALLPPEPAGPSVPSRLADVGRRTAGAASRAVSAAGTAVRRAAGRWSGRGATRGKKAAKARPSRLRLGRLVVVAAVTAALGGGAAWLSWAAVRPDSTEPDWRQPDPVLEQRIQARPVLRQAAAAMEAGQPEAALRLYRAAEGLAPDVEEIAENRRRAERRMVRQAEAARTEERAQLDETLTRAREAADAGRWTEARSAAEEALALDEGNARAQAIVAEADRARAARARRAEASREDRAGAGGDASQAELADGADAAEDARASAEDGAAGVGGDSADAEASGPARLAIDFYSAYPEGVLTVYLDDSQLLREPYRFVRRERLFRTEGTPGRIRNEYEVSPGAVTVRILLALPDRPAITRVLEANFPAGITRRLRIRLDEGPELTARLE